MRVHFESPVRDAKLTARGDAFGGGAGNVDVQTRTGNGERPDATGANGVAPTRIRKVHK